MKRPPAYALYVDDDEQEEDGGGGDDDDDDEDDDDGDGVAYKLNDNIIINACNKKNKKIKKSLHKKQKKTSNNRLYRKVPLLERLRSLWRGSKPETKYFELTEDSP